MYMTLKRFIAHLFGRKVRPLWTRERLPGGGYGWVPATEPAFPIKHNGEDGYLR